MFPKNKVNLEKEYKKLGSTRAVANKFKCSQGKVVYWLKKLDIPTFPTMLHTRGNNTGKGRLAELYFSNLPLFKKKVQDLLFTLGDKSDYDSLLEGRRINWKSCHYKRAIFRIKAKRHKCDFYGVALFNDKVSRVIPRKKWLIPSNEVPLTTLTIGLKNSKYNKYLLPISQEDKTYNRTFGRKYSKFLPRKKDSRNNKKLSFFVGKNSDRGFKSYDVATQKSIGA